MTMTTDTQDMKKRRELGSCHKVREAKGKFQTAEHNAFPHALMLKHTHTCTDHLAATTCTRRRTFQTHLAGVKRIVVFFRRAQIACFSHASHEDAAQGIHGKRRALVRRCTAEFEHQLHLDRQPFYTLKVPSQVGHFRGLLLDAAGRLRERAWEAPLGAWKGGPVNRKRPGSSADLKPDGHDDEPVRRGSALSSALVRCNGSSSRPRIFSPIYLVVRRLTRSQP